ncbi:LTA synthase family protein [Mesorhizobium sp. LHD-90]|uniref:LTA synthase family protein n=1 Tax=Mesorhizobium sp. LHD-90 TaxID=3071414 RepID=UPI0027DECC0F|nr:LTA synthase family protein [Mesorhizobium sp. LHD-90]MDQ6434988.1 LTA synthase family protein [Mesorhizobium sp. LHD-90]
MAPFGHPLVLVAASFAVALAVTVALDRFALPAKVRAANRPAPHASRLADLLVRAVVAAVIFALFFAISWRPLYAAAGTVSTFVIFTLISRAKYEYIREPLVFSDIALVMLVFRHKELFYANWLNVAFWAGAFTYVFGASALFMIFEPSVLPAMNRPALIALMVLVAAVPWLLPLEPHARRMLATISASVTGGQDIKLLTVRLGTLAAVACSFLAWLGTRPAPLLAPAEPGIAAPAIAGAQDGRPLVVIWQSESFMDMRHFGVSPLALPNLDRLRERATEWGRMSSIFEGGYTLRTEFSVISGLPPEQLGPDAAHPYLRAGPYADVAWPNRFRKAGWSTHFIHPYDRQFFSRDRALPQLGFDALTMLDAFDHDREHEGPYVSDLTLSKRVVDCCRDDHADKGQFLFAASMENHGPWKPGRHGAADDPLQIYLAILERSDAALGHLADELDRMDRPIWLAFYGDHAPILKSFADPFPDPRTDYLIVPMARAAAGTMQARAPAEKAPWRIIADMVRHAGFDNGLAGISAAGAVR